MKYMKCNCLGPFDVGHPKQLHSYKPTEVFENTSAEAFSSIFVYKIRFYMETYHVFLIEHMKTYHQTVIQKISSFYFLFEIV